MRAPLVFAGQRPKIFPMKLPSGILSHYEKVICACCFLIMFTTIGLASTSFSVYQSYIVELPGVGHTGGAIVLGVRNFTSFVCMFFVAAYFRWLDVRLGVLLGCLLEAAGFFIYSLAAGLPLLCVGAFIVGAGYGLGGAVAVTLLIGRWYHTHVGTASGIAMVGSGVAGMLVPPAVAHLVATYSLQVAFATEAAVALACALIIFVLLRNHPEELNLRPYGEGEEQAEKSAPVAAARNLEQLPRLQQGLMHFAMMCVGACCIVGNGYLGVLYTTSGFDEGVAALLIAVGAFSLAASKLVSGFIFDKLGHARASFIFFLLLIVGLSACATCVGLSQVVAAACAILIGVGLTLGTVGMTVWAIGFAPPNKLAKTTKNFQLCYVGGGLAFGFVPGILMDVCGNYQISYALMALFAVAATLIIARAYRA